MEDILKELEGELEIPSIGKAWKKREIENNDIVYDRDITKDPEELNRESKSVSLLLYDEKIYLFVIVVIEGVKYRKVRDMVEKNDSNYIFTTSERDREVSRDKVVSFLKDSFYDECRHGGQFARRVDRGNDEMFNNIGLSNDILDNLENKIS